MPESTIASVEARLRVLISEGKRRANEVLFDNGAGITRRGIFFSSLIHEGRRHYFHISTIEEKQLGLDALSFGETCDLGQRLASELFPKPTPP